MALTTESAKPDPKKTAPAKPDAEQPAERPEVNEPGVDRDDLPKLVAAPGATDPAVQKLQADQQTAVSNGDADAIRDINRQLNELGYK